MIKFKEYIDFITSLVEMDEVKQNKFKLPHLMVFNLEMFNHREIQKEVLRLKEEEIISELLVEPFEVNILGVTLRFVHEGYED